MKEMTRTPELGYIGTISLWKAPPPGVVGRYVPDQRLIGITSLESGEELFEIINGH